MTKKHKNVIINKIHIVKGDKKNSVEFNYAKGSGHSVDIEAFRKEIKKHYKADKVYFTFTEIE